MLSLLPLHISVVERSGGLLSWIGSWWPKQDAIIYLTTNEWYSKTFCRGNFIQIPPSAAADAAIEQLCRNVHLYPLNCHIVCIPQIMMGRWRKQLLKVANYLFLCRWMIIFGRKLILNHSYLQSFSLFIIVHLKNSRTPSISENVKGACGECGLIISFWEGIFCANFSQSRDHWKTYQGIWCGGFYRAPECEDYRVVHSQE